jgi:hypothetical protein
MIEVKSEEVQPHGICLPFIIFILALILGSYVGYKVFL